jgi:TorA maturation chaperone TorD
MVDINPFYSKFKEVAKTREDTYGFLSSIFREDLKRGQIKGMIETGLFNLFVETGYDIDLNFFMNKSLQQIEEELAVEYTSLFIGPGRHLPPYESIYLSDSTGRYWGESTVDMKNWVEHYGLQISERFRSIPPDHISIELEFMQRVIEQEGLGWEKDAIDTAERCIEVERRFLNQHIIKWIPEFCKSVVERASLDLYRETARLTMDFILEEEDLLG